jgi:CxxC motif-containing protein (DUF1111 family)
VILPNLSHTLAIAVTLTLTASMGALAQDQDQDQLVVERAAQARAARFQHSGTVAPESSTATTDVGRLTEAPTGFDNRTNGFLVQGPPFGSLNEDTVEAQRSFNDDRFIFEEIENIADGLGPTYNAQGCRECHENVVTGGASQIAEHRTGRVDASGGFFESLGGTLIHSRATNAAIVERVAFEDDVRTFRISTNTLGAGFIEATSNETMEAIRNAQPEQIRGTLLMVPVLEAANGTARYGRFGWKDQHASLESFAGDAYLNEMGITNPLFPDENTSAGRNVGFGTPFDPVRDPEDDGDDVKAFADFMRSTKAPPRGAITRDVIAGDVLFRQVGCVGCHVATLRTAAPGTPINGGTFVVPAALGNKLFHPYSDFMLHNIGTGDGIPVLPGPEYAHTTNLIRTAPLWALRTRNRLMHDGLSFTKQEAIARHAGQAANVVKNYNALSADQKRQVLAFLDSL